MLRWQGANNSDFAVAGDDLKFATGTERLESGGWTSGLKVWGEREQFESGRWQGDRMLRVAKHLLRLPVIPLSFLLFAASHILPNHVCCPERPILMSSWEFYSCLLRISTVPIEYLLLMQVASCPEVTAGA